jgi:hypothetical protein
MMAQYKGVWFSMNFSCSSEENETSYAWHASEQLSRMPEAPAAEGCCLTKSRTRFDTVECTFSFVVRDAPKLNQPLPFNEARLAELGVTTEEGQVVDCKADPDCVCGFDVFSS